MSDEQDIAEDAGLDVPPAVAGIRRLRDRLMAAVPEFRATVEAGRETDAFIASVRAELVTRRKSAGLRQEDVARELGVTQSAVSKLETGPGDLGLGTLAEYCRAIGYRPVVLMVPTAAASAALTRAGHRGDALAAARASGAGTRAAAPVAAADPASAAAVEQAQVALLRGMSDMMPGVLAGLIRPT